MVFINKYLMMYVLIIMITLIENDYLNNEN